MFKRPLTLISRFNAVYFQLHAQYRLGVLLWILNGMISPLILMYVWLVVNRNQSLAFNQNQIITYYLLSILVIRLTQTWTAESLSRLIKDGQFSQYLVRPISFLYPRLAQDFSLRLIRLLSLTPFIILTLFIFRQNLSLPLNPANIIWFLFTIFLGYLISLTIELAVAFTSFFLTDAYGTFLLLYLFKDLFSGTLIPLSLMPPVLLTLSHYLPFYPQLGLPIDILMGTISLPQAAVLTLINLAWLAIIIIIARFVYHQGLKKYTAVGI